MVDELQSFIITNSESFNHKYDYKTLTVDPQIRYDKPFEPKMVYYDNYMDYFNQVENSFTFHVNKTAAIVAGAVVALVLIALVVFLIRRRKHR